MKDLANFDINWGGAGFPSYEGKLEIAAADTGTADASGSSTTGTGADGSNTASPADDGGDASSASSANAENIRVMREGYNEYRDKWSKLGDYNQVAAAHQTVTKLQTEGVGLAKSLGYDAADFANAFKADPVKTLQILRDEAAKAQSSKGGDGSGKDIAQLIKQQVAEATKPINEQLNLQLTEKANNLFDTTIKDLVSKDFPADKALPASTNQLLYDMVSEILKYDNDGLVALKMEGKTASIQAAYKEAKDMLTKAFTDWQTAQSKQINGPGPNNAGAGKGAGNEKVTLDDFINATPAAAKRSGTFR